MSVLLTVEFACFLLIFVQGQDIRDGHKMNENRTFVCLKSFSARTILLDQDGTSKIVCNCDTVNNSSIIWLDGGCNEILKGNEKYTPNQDGSLKVTIAEKDQEEWYVQCTNGHNCSNAVRITHEKDEDGFINQYSTGINI